MATAKKVTKKEEKVSSVQLNPAVWEVPYNADLIAQVIYVMRSNARQGDANAKTRADVKGGGRKPWKQKGTGRARAGSIRSPLWRKGGVTFVPNFRNWARKINKKMRQLAVRVLLSQRLREERVEFISLSSKSTMSEIRKQFVGLMVKGWTLVVTGSEDVARGLNNVEKIMVVKPEELNAYVLTIAKKVLVDNDAVKVIESKYTNEK